MREALFHATREAARASGGRPVPAANLHVTLAFLGAVPERKLEELAHLARASAARAAVADSPDGGFGLVFDHLEHWRAGQLLCALPKEASAAIAALARGLQNELAAGGFAPDLKSSGAVEPSAFRPHVTVARKVYRPARRTEIDPVIWSFVDFVLVDSRTLPEGAVYAVLERFSLDP
jgi:2'-5' RNA ligase